MQNTPGKIILHHTAASVPSPQFLEIDNWHRKRGFPRSKLGFYVGYHYVIEKDGKLMQARHEDEMGAHTIGENLNSIGICLVGDFDNETPTEIQRGVLGSLLSALCRRYSLDESNIFPHNVFKDTRCPGKNLAQNWGGFVYLEHEIRKFQARLDNLPVEYKN